MIDEKRVLAMLGNIDEYYKEFIEMLPDTFAEYKKSLERKRACERTIQLLMEECIDICNVLQKGLKLGVPDEEEMIFDKLAEKNILSEEMSSKLKEMKKFRNVLVHKYAKVDDALAYENMKGNNKDFKSFKEEILGFLREQRKSKKGKTRK